MAGYLRLSMRQFSVLAKLPSGSNLTLGSRCAYRELHPYWFAEGIAYRQWTMIALLCFVLAVLAASFKSKSRLEAENAALQH